MRSLEETIRGRILHSIFRTVEGKAYEIGLLPSIIGISKHDVELFAEMVYACLRADARREGIEELQAIFNHFTTEEAAEVRETVRDGLLAAAHAFSEEARALQHYFEAIEVDGVKEVEASLKGRMSLPAGSIELIEHEESELWEPAISKVTEFSRAKGRAFNTLQAIASSCSPRGEQKVESLSIAMIAHYSGASERSTMRHIKELVNLGELEVQHSKSVTSIYRIPFCQYSRDELLSRYPSQRGENGVGGNAAWHPSAFYRISQIFLGQEFEPYRFRTRQKRG